MRTQRVKLKTKNRQKTLRKRMRVQRVKGSSKKNKKTRKTGSKKKKINKSKQKKIRAGVGSGRRGQAAVEYKTIIKGLTSDIIKLKRKLIKCGCEVEDNHSSDRPLGRHLAANELVAEFIEITENFGPTVKEEYLSRIQPHLKDYKESPRARRVEQEKKNVEDATTPPGTPAPST